MLGADNAIWDDGEWVSWHEINQQIEYKEWGAKYPNADRSLVPVFEQLLGIAEQYYRVTGRHLNLYGDIGELFGAITYGFKLNRNNAQGSDGRLGNDLIEVKTISPFKYRDEVVVNMTRNFSKLLVVNINQDFEIAHRLIDRNSLPSSTNKQRKIKWSNL